MNRIIKDTHYSLLILIITAVMTCGSPLYAQSDRPDHQAWHSVTSYIAQTPSINFDPLGRALVSVLSSNVTGQFSLYVEDIDTGLWLGINDQASYEAWSLYKVAVMATILRKIQLGQLDPETELTLREQDIDLTTIFPQNDSPGDQVTIRQLLERLIRFSDNTASFVLAHRFTPREFQNALQSLGLPTAAQDQPNTALPRVSPRQFANALRSFYYPGWLQEPFGKLALELMSTTRYTSQIQDGLPSGIRVAHKVGFNAAAGDFHDCGIIVAPQRTYLLCIMSTGSTREEADRVISALSRAVYRFWGEPPRN